MTQKKFGKFIDHFIHHVKPSKEDPVLLFLDNHSSHVNIEVVKKAKENNIILLPFPPHCSHHLQPLDVGVNGPLKNYLNRAQTSWMSSNPGKTMTIYDLPGIVKDVFHLALNPRNVINAIRKSGTWSFNVFQDSDFAPSYLTDRPDPTNQDPSSNSNNSDLLNDMPNLDSSTVVIAHVFNGPVAGPSGLQRHSSDFSIETVRPLPKAPSNRKWAKKSAILTDTPEKNALEQEKHIRELKKRIVE